MCFTSCDNLARDQFKLRRRPDGSIAHATQERRVHGHDQAKRRIALAQGEIAEDHLGHSRAFTAQRVRDGQCQVASARQLGQALGRKRAVAVVL